MTKELVRFYASKRARPEKGRKPELVGGNRVMEKEVDTKERKQKSQKKKGETFYLTARRPTDCQTSPP